jgi:phosphopantothenoylcysteine decarboxylase / phosphopantothenate---cysteine ligase
MDAPLAEAVQLPDLLGKRILLVVTGGIAAYKALELIRLLRKSGASVRAVLTKAGAEFVTPLSVGALTEDKVYTDLWSLTDEAEMGHIRLSREADLIVVAPATADLLAKMALGIADDLASTTLLAGDKTVLVAPAMNFRMWEHPATVTNLATLESRGVLRVGPAPGPMACGEFGTGRMAEPAEILQAVAEYFATSSTGRLKGWRVLVTSGPTREAIDPVRFISNHSSGKQGHAIAAAFARLGAEVVLVTGPTAEPPPAGVTVTRVESAEDMLNACQAALPVDVAVCAAAVSDWRVAKPAGKKLKKHGDDALELRLTQTPDILKTLSKKGPKRPRLVVGFALETDDLMKNAAAKLKSKGCDWIVANEAAQDGSVFGSDYNSVALFSADGIDSWPRVTKSDVGQRLAAAAADVLSAPPSSPRKTGTA